MGPGNIYYKLRKKKVTPSRIISWCLRWANSRYITNGASLPPLRLFINVNSRCNARCSQCDVGIQATDSMFYQTMIGDGNHELSLSKVKEILEELSAEKPLIAFNGVEPTLWKPLPEAVMAATSLGMETQITTNGILLPKLADDLFNAGIGSVWVSLDGPGDIHDSIRGIPGCFEKAVAGLRRLHELKIQNGSSKPSLNVVGTIFHSNQGSMLDLLRFLADSGIAIDEVMLHHLQFITEKQAEEHNRKYGRYPVTAISSGSSDPCKVDIEKLAEEIERVENAGLYLNIRWKPFLRSSEELAAWYRQPEKFIGNDRCRVFWTEIQLLANGELTGSQRCFPLHIGNINQTPIKELWNGPKMREWRMLIQREGALTACSRCCSLL